MILKLFESQGDAEAMIAMITSISHCINLIANNTEVFFDLVSAVLNVSFRSNYDIALTLTEFSTSLASISSNYNKLIFSMLYRELMELAPAPVSTKETEPLGRGGLAESSRRQCDAYQTHRPHSFLYPVGAQGVSAEWRDLSEQFQPLLPVHHTGDVSAQACGGESSAHVFLRSGSS